MIAPAPFIDPAQSLAQLADWGTEHLSRVIAQDSQSDDGSDAIPSTEGQRHLSQLLAAFFADLGYVTQQDAWANLTVGIPSNLPPGAAPTVALMAHLDTAKGTHAVAQLDRVASWDGCAIPFSANQRLEVSVARYPDTGWFLGEDVLHGPGDAPIGLDDKLGMAEMMTLARVLAGNPGIPHGELLLVFRPDEEIGRMGAVEGLADQLRAAGVTHGYTIDGLAPFEINVENFNAARALVTAPGAPLTPPAGLARRLVLDVFGCRTHGATAKGEGYLNAVVVLARAAQRLAGRQDLIAATMTSDDEDETNARVTWHITGADEAALDRAQGDLLAALAAELAPHTWKGARVEVVAAHAPAPGAPLNDALTRLLAHVHALLTTPGPTPLLSEDSEGRQGYSNPYAITPSAGGLALAYRLRDFSEDGLSARERHVQQVCAAARPPLAVETARQYVNMGPALVDHPELVTWASDALAPLGRDARRDPIRGGTGVDPFLVRGIPVANLGTGYFAPESEKEITSRQNIARHALWLTYLVQRIARG